MKKIILGTLAAAAAAVSIAAATAPAYATSNNKGGTIHIVATVKADVADPNSGGFADATYTHTFDGTYDKATGAFEAIGSTVSMTGRPDYSFTSYANPEHVTGTFKAGKLTFTAEYEGRPYTWSGTAKTSNGKGGEFSKSGVWSTVNPNGEYEYHNAALTGSVAITDTQG